jgi:hypothetical protein
LAEQDPTKPATYTGPQRTDHIGRILNQPTPTAGQQAQAQAQAKADEASVPTITPTLVEYLQGQFQRPTPTIARTADQAIEVAALEARHCGHLEVIAHLQTLLSAQQQKA